MKKRFYIYILGTTLASLVAFAFFKMLRSDSLQACLASLNAVLPQACYEAPEIMTLLTTNSQLLLHPTQVAELIMNSKQKLDCKHCDLPTDPWGQPFAVRIARDHSIMTVDAYSFGPDKKDGTSDDIHQIR